MLLLCPVGVTIVFFVSFLAETVFQEFWCNSNICIYWNDSFHIHNWVSWAHSYWRLGCRLW